MVVEVMHARPGALLKRTEANWQYPRHVFPHTAQCIFVGT
jgi:hypothetical protein